MSWTKIADQLPKYEDRVLLVRRESPMWPVLIGYRKFTDRKGEHFARDVGDEIAAPPTHWQTLPEDPPP